MCNVIVADTSSTFRDKHVAFDDAPYEPAFDDAPYEPKFTSIPTYSNNSRYVGKSSMNDETYIWVLNGCWH